MDFEFKRFQQEHFDEYASWFVDPELNHLLGPMDQAWLEAVLAQPESEGVTWAVFRGRELVAIAETIFDPEQHRPAVISAVATKPGCRGQGIGSTVLRQLLSLHKDQGLVEHVAYISVHNPAGRGCAAKAGFVPVTSQPDEHGFMEYRHYQ